MTRLVNHHFVVMQGHGRAARAKPELVLNNFDTRLGHRLGRMFASLFHQDPSFRSRQVATLHNQRDFIFFRCGLPHVLAVTAIPRDCLQWAMSP